MNKTRLSLVIALSCLIWLCSNAPLRADEIRSLWVLPWSLTNPQQIDQMIRQAVNNSQNELLLEVRYRSDALYTTNRIPNSYPNPEYRSYILNGSSFDPLDYAIRQAKLHDLKVHAWVVTFNATPTAAHLLENNFIYKNHRDWLTYENDKGIMRSTEAFGYFVDPAIPAAREHVHNVICDLASGYPELDGIHLDYIRYPNTNFGYHPVSIALYNRYKEEYPDLEWNEWRMLQVTSFVRDLRNELKVINPRLVLSAAVFPVLNEARNQYAQDWRNWLDNDLVDRVYPMLYHKEDAAFNRILDAIKAYGHENRIVMGIRAWDTENGSLVPDENARQLDYNIFNVLDRIDWIRNRNLAGIALFSYDGLVKGGGLNFLGERAYRSSPVVTVPPEILAMVEARKNSTEPVAFAPDIFLNTTYNDFSIQLVIPTEGRWTLQIYSEDNLLIWERNRYYLAGTNQDIIDLPQVHTSSEEELLFCHIFREEQDYKYIIPLKISRIWQN